MTLLFVDGFEGLVSPGNVPNARKWYTPNVPNNAIVNGRFGGYGLNCRQYACTKPISEVTDTLLCGFAMYRPQYISSLGLLGSFQIVTFNQNVQGIHCYVSVNKDDYLAFYRNGIGTADVLLGTGTHKVPPFNWFYIEVKVKISTTVGTVNVRVNGLDDIVLTNVNTHGDESVTPANTTDGVMLFTDLSQGGAVTISSGIISCNTTNNGPYYDDFYLCDTNGSVNNSFLGEVYINTILANGAGASTQWTPNTGNNFSDISEQFVDDDTTYVAASTLGNIDTYTFAPLTITHVVGGLGMNVVGRLDASGSHNVSPVVRVGGTNYVGSGLTFASTSYGTNQEIYETNPATGLPWTVSDVNNAQFGIDLTS